jgi:predicted dehydrogenase
MLPCEPVLIVGCGSIGRRHARNLQALGATQIQLVDADRAAAEAVADECGAQVAVSLDAALERGAASVFICTPSDVHIATARRAAAAGADLFIEKPLSHSLAGVSELVQTADDRQLVTMVACNMRFHPGPRAVKRLLDEHAIGDVIAARVHTGSYLPGWRPQQDYRRSYSASASHGGAILDCIHEIDLALWYFGPARLHSCAAIPAGSIDLETDGLAELILQHHRGVLASVHLNFVQRDYSRSCVVIGTDGTIEWQFRDHEVRVLGTDGTVRERIAEPAGWDMNQMYVDEIAHFVDAMQTRQPTTNPIAAGAATLQIALDARVRGREVVA